MLLAFAKQGGRERKRWSVDEERCGGGRGGWKTGPYFRRAVPPVETARGLTVCARRVFQVNPIGGHVTLHFCVQNVPLTLFPLVQECKPVKCTEESWKSSLFEPFSTSCPRASHSFFFFFFLKEDYCIQFNFRRKIYFFLKNWSIVCNAYEDAIWTFNNFLNIKIKFTNGK